MNHQEFLSLIDQIAAAEAEQSPEKAAARTDALQRQLSVIEELEAKEAAVQQGILSWTADQMTQLLLLEAGTEDAADEASPGEAPEEDMDDREAALDTTTDDEADDAQPPAVDGEIDGPENGDEAAPEENGEGDDQEAVEAAEENGEGDGQTDVEEEDENGEGGDQEAVEAAEENGEGGDQEAVEAEEEDTPTDEVEDDAELIDDGIPPPEVSTGEVDEDDIDDPEYVYDEETIPDVAASAVDDGDDAAAFSVSDALSAWGQLLQQAEIEKQAGRFRVYDVLDRNEGVLSRIDQIAAEEPEQSPEKAAARREGLQQQLSLVQEQEAADKAIQRDTSFYITEQISDLLLLAVEDTEGSVPRIDEKQVEQARAAIDDLVGLLDFQVRASTGQAIPEI